MNKVLQGGLFCLYRTVKATGVLNTSWGRRVFESAYFVYKDRFEAGPIEMLRRWIKPRTVVIDVGANVGFFTRRFASWVREGGRVIALEPEAVNYASLQRTIARTGLSAVVETIQAAAAEATGQGFLELNPQHPADHKLGVAGKAVALVKLDDLLRDRDWPEVSLIKVDVQGAEARVLAGAKETLARFHPALFLEVEDQKLKDFGSSARELLASCVAQGYGIHARAGEDITAPLSMDQALALVQTEKYTDLLMLATDRGPGLSS